MIQRIQTLYLLVGAALLGAFMTLSGLWAAPLSTLAAWITPVVFVLAGVATGAGLIAIFLYKQRASQRIVVGVAQWLALLLVLVLAGAMGTLSFQGDAEATPVGMASWGAVLLVVVGYVCFHLARRGIAKDIELVRSMDRLR